MVYRYDNRDDHPLIIGSPRIKRFTEIHNVYTMLPQRRTDWWGRIGLACLNLKLYLRNNPFCHVVSVLRFVLKVKSLIRRIFIFNVTTGTRLELADLHKF